MKPRISVIVVQRQMSASEHGFTTDSNVQIYRGSGYANDWSGSSYHTNPSVRSQNRISNASVIRAKRAQIALLERAAQDQDA